MNIKKSTIEIEGMHCASCVTSVENALTGINGVAEATVNLATETTQVKYAPSAVVVDDFVNAVDNVGYRVVQETEPEDRDMTQEEVDRDQQKMDSNIIGMIVFADKVKQHSLNAIAASNVLG